jgi:hypothetical protein
VIEYGPHALTRTRAFCSVIYATFPRLTDLEGQYSMQSGTARHICLELPVELLQTTIVCFCEREEKRPFLYHRFQRAKEAIPLLVSQSSQGKERLSIEIYTIR